jgi:hypothetical protein
VVTISAGCCGLLFFGFDLKNSSGIPFGIYSILLFSAPSLRRYGTSHLVMVIILVNSFIFLP